MTKKNIALPALCNRALELGLLNMEPWYAVNDEQCAQLLLGFSIRYPHLRVRPFARRQDCDDIACICENESIVVIHDFASEGWEKRKQFADFSAWLRVAIDDFIEFNS